MFNLDTVTSNNDDKKWPYIMLIIGLDHLDQETQMHYLI